MSAVQILPPFPTFKDVDGDPLNDGLIYIGVAGANPITSPVNVFFDSALTIPAAQPVRTIGGYASNGGVPSRLYIAETSYSIIVRNKNSTTIVFVSSQGSDFGDVFGPVASVDSELPLFSGTTGELLKNSGTVVTAAGLALVGGANAAAQATTLGLGTGNTPTFSALNLALGQITFPAVQVPSAGANVLDDYEEGTWTVVLTFVTPGNLALTYTTQSGEYTKVGNRVMCTYDVVTATFTHTTASGNLQLTGLPFTIAARSFGTANFQGITKASYTAFSPRFTAGDVLLTVAAAGSGVPALSVTAADMPTGGTIVLQGAATFRA